METTQNEIKGLAPNINAVFSLMAVAEMLPVRPVELKWDGARLPSCAD
jgi:hypothetical protein